MNEDKFQDNKKFLKRYKPYYRQIQRLEERLYELSSHIESTQSSQISGMPGGGIPRTLSDEIIEREELESRINVLLKESRLIKLEIITAIDHLDNANQAAVLEMFFVKDMSLDCISEMLGYSFRQTNRLYKQGLLNDTLKFQ